jgi:predicted Rossmann-fold nucleotide-binding protein
MPGGTGTLEEIAESLAHCNLGLIAGKCVFLNINGYYEPMRTMLDAMTAAGYMAAHERANAIFADSVEELEDYLK